MPDRIFHVRLAGATSVSVAGESFPVDEDGDIVVPARLVAHLQSEHHSALLRDDGDASDDPEEAVERKASPGSRTPRVSARKAVEPDEPEPTKTAV